MNSDTSAALTTMVLVGAVLFVLMILITTAPGG
jgi:hypothetical protein